MARPRRLLLVNLLTLVAGLAWPVAAHGQTLRVAVGGALDATSPAGQAARASVGIDGAAVGDTRVSLALSYDGAAQLDLGLQANDTFGPLGNVIGEADLAIRTDGPAQGSLRARGVLGPVALGVTLSAFSSDPARFDPLAVASDTRPRFGAAGWGVALDASGRLDRAWIAEAHPALYLVQGQAAWVANARLRWLRAIGPHELSLRLTGYLAPGGSAGDGALGVGFSYRRRGAPALDGALYLGVGPDGLRPGATASLGQPFGPLDATLALAVEPYRLDRSPYRARLDLTAPLGDGRLGLSAAATAGPAGPRGVLRLDYAVPVRLP